MKSVWNEAKALIRKQVPEHSYNMWLKPVKLHKTKDNIIILSCPNNFSKKQVVTRYEELIRSVTHDTCGRGVSVEFTVIKEKKNEITITKAKPKTEPSNTQIFLPGMNTHPNWARKLRKDFTFDQFVVGSNNDFAYSAALSIASKPARGLNSLFMLSKTGLGKSHLAQAVGHHVISQYPGKQVYYVTVEDFTNEMVTCYKNNDIAQFKDKYRKKCDILLIDDVQYLSGKIGTQKELASTLDFLMDRGKKIIFASSELPSDIPKLSDKLKSRLCSGLISNLEIPDYKIRSKILKKKAKSSGYTLPNEVIQYLAGEISGDIRQLESALVGVAARASLMGINPNLAFAENVIKKITSHQATITIGSIKKLICQYYNVTVQDLISKSRRKAIVWPRQIAMYLSRRYTDHSLQSIGKGFNRYHATCMHSIKVIDKAASNDVVVQKQLELLSGKLESGDLNL